MTIRNFPVAQALYIKYCKEHNPQALSEIYIQEDDFNSQAELFLRDSLNPNVCIIIFVITIKIIYIIECQANIMMSSRLFTFTFVQI